MRTTNSHTIFWMLLLAASFIKCGSSHDSNMVKIEGKTQGTTFHISYVENNSITYEKEIDSILKVIDNSLSTYVESSLISNFNASHSGSRIDEHMLKVFWKSLEIFHYTNGMFDPTVKPLINFWGFGSDKINVVENIDPSLLDSLLDFVGLDKVQLYERGSDTVFQFLSAKEFPEGEYYLQKASPSVQLDFNAIAQGYTVDVVGEFLEMRGVQNYLVEIGGELRARGKNAKGEYWKIGIDRPSDESRIDRPLQAVLSLKNKSVATSGNYRKFYLKDGVKYSHTLNPKTGYPSQHNLLSVSVVAVDCATADGYATALMAMGLEKAKELVYANSFLEAYMIYSDENGDWKTFMTDGMKDIIEEKN